MGRQPCGYNRRMTPTGSQAQVWTTRRLLQWTTQYFEKHGIDDHPRLAAEMLLAHVLGVERLKLYMDPERPASELERATFRDLVERAKAHEPVDYLIGHAPFFSMLLKVTPDVLIPRTSTETVVEHVIQHARRTPGFHEPTIADIGTGSGAIAIALAKHVPGCSVVATDTSAAALAVAEENARMHEVDDRIEFRHGDLLEPLGNERVRFLVSNPPYISDDQWEAVEPNVKDHEPTGALRGGADGLDCIRRIIADGPQRLMRPGQLVLEIGFQHGPVVSELAEAAGFINPQILTDHESLPRVLVADLE